jgi:putative membrane protein insertion efficiency factor
VSVQLERPSRAVPARDDSVRGAFSRSPVAGVLALVVRAYQLAVAPLLGARCRFHPSCSRYALEALCVHGAWRGLALSITRIARCQPLSAGGFDPVPPPSGCCDGPVRENG